METIGSPRAILKAWRPERFSDSVPLSVPVIDRSTLEYHLDSLTSRSQEADFAKFAMRLAECEICPNILPQTGPTGGGDSKADAETYPVADSLSLAWHTGIGREAATERWAFAFSAMEKWRPKVQSDIAKIAATGRGYTKAFFVTNQFVRDKSRAELEDKLRTKHKLDVRILDRTWILDRVFGGRHEQLAIDELRLTTPVRQEVRKGPLDVQRETDLAAIEQRIQAAAQSDAYTSATVDECLEAAELARGLDRSRVEVDGLYLRAERLAKKIGDIHQQLECSYSKAWTTFWWFEDYDTFSVTYGEVERLAKKGRNVYHFELLYNLRSLLFSAVLQGALPKADAKLAERTSTLTRELDRLTSESTRPSAALQARSMKLSIKLTEAKPAERDTILRQITEVIGESDGLVGFPLESLAETYLRLGEYLGDVPAYTELFEKIMEVMAKRKGEVVAARMLWGRGGQELGAGRPYESIRLLGRALTHLHKHESRDDAVGALLLCSSAYEQTGLFWAARGSALAAAALAAGDYWTYSEVTQLQADSFGVLRRLELRLGRLPQALAWHSVCCAATQTLVDSGKARDDARERHFNFDGTLGILFLKADFTVLPLLNRLPDALKTLGLEHGAVALLFSLGHEDQIPAELAKDMPGGRDLDAFFALWRDQPASTDIPDTMILSEGMSVRLTSNVLGCQVVVDSANTPPCVELAESLLAALESFVATGHSERMIGREPMVIIRITKADSAEQPFGFTVGDAGGRPCVDVTCNSFSPHNLTRENLGKVRSRLLDLLVQIVARVFHIHDVDQVFGILVRDELALDRSIHFTGSFVTVGNVLGDNPKNKLSDWLHADTKEYQLQRSVVWDAADRIHNSFPGSDGVNRAPQTGHGASPTAGFNPERMRHDKIRTLSIIREPLWNQAGWSGTVFLWERSGTEPPAMALMFKDGDAAAEIFKHLHVDVGADDRNEAMRVSIIRGIDRQNPHYYRIVVGTNPEAADSLSPNRMVVLVSRIQTMMPSNSSNLNNFLDNFARAKSYCLTYALPPSGTNTPKIASRPWITKTHLHVREAWQIGLHDLDSAGLLPGDDPIVPAGEQDVPVHKLMKWKMKHHDNPIQ